MYPATTAESRQEGHSAQSVHLHMHHVCPCPCLNMATAYPFCPPSIYRPPLVAYQTRPYNLHHYQYTQYNMIPYGTATSSATTVLPQPQVASVTPNSQGGADMVFGPPPRDRRQLDRSNGEEATEKVSSASNNNPEPDYASYLADTKEASSPEPVSSMETFVKFLEDSCLRAEQIAYRNRNRPCFRNIQNLCMRTRGEILKPCTTISNIHSQGIPWATKDFIYAFVRLVNCWHILKGYLDNEGGLGKIEKELSEEFKACYYRWEKDSMELAEELRRIFCNLDANLSGSSNPSHNENHHSSTRDQQNSASVVTVVEKRDIGVGTVASKAPKGEVSSLSSSKEGDSDNENNNKVVYMKPGSYNVPRRAAESSNNSPRSFEFLETAQNTHRRTKEKDKQESSADRIWQNAQSAAPGLISKINPVSASLEKAFEDMIPGGTEVVETWINTGLYPVVKNEENMIKNVSSKPITVLQRTATKCSNLGEEQAYQGERNPFKESLQRIGNSRKMANDNNGSSSTLSKSSCNNNIGRFEITTRTYRKRSETTSTTQDGIRSSSKRTFLEEMGRGKDGISKEATMKMKEIMNELKTTEFFNHLSEETYYKEDQSEIKFPTSLATVAKKLDEKYYRNVEEIVHDIRYIIQNATIFFKGDDNILHDLERFIHLFEHSISVAFPELDFNQVSSEENFIVNLMYRKNKLREGDGDH